MAEGGMSQEEWGQLQEASDNIRVHNADMVETAWLQKAVEHMKIHFNLLQTVPAKSLRLTKYDDEIYEKFKVAFPGFCLGCLEESSLKSDEAKKKWRAFYDELQHKVEDASFGTLIRIDCKLDYSDANTLLVLRYQFQAIEIARNREGLNDSIFGNNSFPAGSDSSD